MLRTGTAGWSIPGRVADRFPGGGSHLERYARVLNAVEINSSFYRPHRRTTYERWATSVPPDFRFAVKCPKAITHDRRFVDCGALLADFVEGVAGLGDKCGPILVQLPPSLAFDATVADAFFGELADVLPGPAVCEPRHASWFEDGAEALLIHRRVARVAADPAKVPAAADPGGWRGLTYRRFHGSPRIYYSDYGAERIADHAASAATERGEVWTIYDNTASGAATEDALMLTARV
jgi:uncharacterized protein YecE (DUF72 family)